MVLLLFVGCRPTDKVQRVTYPFSCLVSITQESIIIEGELTAGLPGCYTIQMTKPNYFAGMTLLFKGGQSKVKWNDWLAEQEVGLPCASVFTKLTSVLDDLARSEKPSRLTKTTAVYDLKGHTVVCDRTSGRPIQIQLQDGTQIHLTYT